MKGGKLFAMGADTPVFNKDPAGDWNGFPVMWVDPKEVDKAKQEERQKQLNALITKYDAVVRMVSAGDGEIPIHRMLKGMIKDNVPPFDSPFVKMHVNLWAGSGIYRVDPEKTYDKVLLQNDARKTAKLEHIITRFGSFKWYGLVARTQKADVSALKGLPRIKALCALLRVLLHIDGRIVHYDLHTGNMAIMQDGTPVIHDVGRMKIRDVLADFAPWEVCRPGSWNKRILRTVLMPIFEWPNYNMDYGQYFYIAMFFKDLRKKGEAPFVKEVFPTPTKEGEWVHNDMPMNEANRAAFEKWLDESSGPTGDALPKRQRHINWIKTQPGLRVYDASGNVVDPKAAPGPFLFLDPPTETRYHQIARVFDILSVLKALAWNMRDGSVAFYYARKTAVKIINLLSTSPPTATKENINKTIRAYLELTGTRNDYDGNTPEDEEYWATKYLDEVNDARSGPKGSAVAAPAPAPAPGADADAKAKLQVALKAAAEASEAIEVGAPPPPDPLNDAAVSAGIIAELDAIPIPVQLALDEAVADASAILRESEDADNSEVLIEKGMILAPKDVEAEAEAEAPPNIKRLSEEDRQLKEPTTADGTIELDSSGNPIPKTGVMEGGAAGKSAVAIPITSWEECPDADGHEQARSDAIALAKTVVGGDPTKIVVYLAHPGAKAKQDIVQGSPYGKPNGANALTYISQYDCDRIILKLAAKGLGWDRPRRGARLNRINLRINMLTDRQVVKDIGIEFGADVPCFLIHKFDKTVADAGLGEGVKAMLDVLKGLCIERNFVINDLHIGNMAIFKGMGVTFDYDMLIEKDEGYATFMSTLKDIHDFSQQYGNLSQFTHGPGMFTRLNSMPDGKEKTEFTERYFCIYDLLSVLASLKIVCKAVGKEGAVDACELALNGESGSTFEGRIAAVKALEVALGAAVWPGETVAKVFDEMPALSQPTNGSIRRSLGSLARVSASPAGGHRTPRRKGLPQLL
jgi:hypothetical protein